MSRRRLLFVTGKLAEPALRRLLAELAPRAGFDYDVAVLPITVAALATTAWISRHLAPVANFERIILPGLCPGDPKDVAQAAGVPAEHGPKDLLDLPDLFGHKAPRDYGRYDISILAEINHVPRLTHEEILIQARKHRADGADLIDLGCDPGTTWADAADTVHVLRDEGFRVSIDSFNAVEVAAAVKAGAELVLSVNRTNVEQARDWGCEVVALPDDPATLAGLDETIARLQKANVPFRIDPVIEPVGFGFAASLGRYLEVRHRYPGAEMMMGVGNLTELTDVDSAGVNVVLLGICQELGIRSVLTTEVINWCRSSVRELDLARRLVYHACQGKVLPKHVEPNLVMLRDPRLHAQGEQTLRELAARITDPNFRIFAERGRIHAMNGMMYLQDEEPFALFAAMQQKAEIDPSHAFYLGYEMAKAATALTLGKNYVQDQALRWGFLTKEEKSHRGPPG
jgi:dihydropteroate synthase-like protein